MIDPNRLSLGARLAEREMVGRSHPQHLQPVLYQHRVREILTASGTESSADEAGVVSEPTANLPDLVRPESRYRPIDVPPVFDTENERGGHWMSFSLGMASGVVCGWALTVIVVATATSIGLQPTNAGIHQSSIRSEVGRSQGGPDLVRVAANMATEELGETTNPRMELAQPTKSAAGDFAIVPASMAGSIGLGNGPNNLTSVAGQPEAIGRFDNGAQNLKVARAGMTSELGEQAQSALTSEKAGDADSRATVARVATAATSPSKPSENARKASITRSSKSAAKRAAINARRRAKRIVRAGSSKRGRNSVAVQNRSGRSAVGALATPAADVAKPGIALTAAGLLKAHPDWAKNLFNSERFTP
ncbi:MAG: hypothetical protein ACR2OV_08940 [Hyphomicrobiaceae bacterium]